MKKGGEQSTIYMSLSMDPHSYIDIVHLLIHRTWPVLNILLVMRCVIPCCIY